MWRYIFSIDGKTNEIVKHRRSRSNNIDDMQSPTAEKKLAGGLLVSQCHASKSGLLKYSCLSVGGF